MRIIIGLGNPGEKYKNTRHNAGFMAVEAIAEQHGLNWQNNKKFNAEICKYTTAKIAGTRQYLVSANTNDKKIILVKPLTYINNSGQTVQTILSYYKLLPKKFGLITSKNSNLSNVLTIIHDDLDIKLGEYKISKNSRSAGHKGVESIINHLKTKNFKRIRIGISAKGRQAEIADKTPAGLPRRIRQPAEEAGKFVLQKFNKEEIKIINNLIAKLL
ncbi:MAG: aminoacyl-tRNA hydrolase [Patescibacteria group bacterium]|nr:aminoacyl-tRNA hydrolase [Patescibacteria group bacterium]